MKSIKSVGSGATPSIDKVLANIDGFDNEHHPSSPINRAACRKLIFARLAHLRGTYLSKKLTRVSESSFEWLEARVQNLIDDEIRPMPTTGKTIYLGRR